MGCEFTELYPVLLSLTISPGKKLSIESYYEHKYIRFKTNLLILFNEKKRIPKFGWLKNCLPSLPRRTQRAPYRAKMAIQNVGKLVTTTDGPMKRRRWREWRIVDSAIDGTARRLLVRVFVLPACQTVCAAGESMTADTASWRRQKRRRRWLPLRSPSGPMTAQFRGRRPLGPRLHFPPLRRPSDYPIPAPRKNVPIHDADRVFQFHQPRQRPTIGFFFSLSWPPPLQGVHELRSRSSVGCFSFSSFSWAILDLNSAVIFFYSNPCYIELHGCRGSRRGVRGPRFLPSSRRIKRRLEWEGASCVNTKRIIVDCRDYPMPVSRQNVSHHDTRRVSISLTSTGFSTVGFTGLFFLLFSYRNVASFVNTKRIIVQCAAVITGFWPWKEKRKCPITIGRLYLRALFLRRCAGKCSHRLRTTPSKAA